LGQTPPAQHYQPSARSYPAQPEDPAYPAEYELRRVRSNGEIKWQGEFLYVSEVLAKEPLGPKPIDEEKWELRYSFHLLGILDQRTNKITPAKGWHGKLSE